MMPIFLFLDPLPYNWIGNPELPVIPKDIENCIQAALTMGWRPKVKGSAFKYIHSRKIYQIFKLSFIRELMRSYT